MSAPEPTLESLIDSVCNVEGKAEEHARSTWKPRADAAGWTTWWKNGLESGFKAGASCVASPLRAALLEAVEELRQQAKIDGHAEQRLIKIRRILSQAAEGESK